MGPEASACNWQGASAASGAKDEQAVRALAITLFTILLSQTSTCGATNACLWSSCSLYSLESVREAHKQHQPNNQNTTTGRSTKANAQIFMLLGKEQRRYTINSALLQYRFVKSTTIKEKKKKDKCERCLISDVKKILSFLIHLLWGSSDISFLPLSSQVTLCTFLFSHSSLREQNSWTELNWTMPKKQISAHQVGHYRVSILVGNDGNLFPKLK